MGRRSKKNKPPDGRDLRPRGQAVPEADDRLRRAGEAAPDPGTQNRWVVLGVCVFLLLAVVLVFGRTAHHEFINYDDDKYVYDNPQVAGGLTAEGIVWAFTESRAANWHPLTWISHMLDCEVYGEERPGGHHLTSVLLHAATAIVLFLVLRRMTGALWPSALVAAVFAVHPLRVESVGWVAERKDVLSGLFFVLTLGAYAYYAGRPSLGRYLAVVLLFALGLMAKPMLVTLPLVLLLLDYWPLGRMTPRAAEQADVPWGRRSVAVQLVVEKIPLLVLTAASCAVTVWAQRDVIMPVERVPAAARVANALVSYVAYLGQFVWPTDLALLYPHPGVGLPVGKITGALLLLLGISAGALVWRRRHPYLLVGWLWYLIMLVPVIGLLQVGSQAMADRYTYLPQIGLCIALAWAVAHLVQRWPDRRWAPGVVAALVVAVLMGCAWQQTSYWQDNETLWTRTLACTSRNAIAHYNFGVALGERKEVDEAIIQYRKALSINPLYAVAHNNLGMALTERGQLDKAIAHHRIALKIKPDYAMAYNSLAIALKRSGRVDEAIIQYEKALNIDPLYAIAHNNLGVALTGRGQLNEAIAHYQKALEIKPDYVWAHNNVGVALMRRGEFDEAITHYQKALEIEPGHVSAQNNLAWLRATCPQASLRDGAEAVELAERAVELTEGKKPEIIGTLAAAYAEAGRFPEAVEAARKALALATQQGRQALADGLKAKISLYEAGTPFRGTPE